MIMFDKVEGEVDLARLERNLTVSKLGVALLFVAVILSYIIKFWSVPIGDAAAWGQFGDYIGGLLNPAIAGAAFYWLATSVKLQKRSFQKQGC